MPKPPHRIDQIQQLANLLQNATKPVDTNAKIRDTTTLQLLTQNIHNLEHPLGWIKHPYFNTLISPNPTGNQELKQRFCEAIVLLLQKHDRLKCSTQPKPRKSPPHSSTPSSSDSSEKPKSNTKPRAPKTKPPS